jgi:hypothetical protein
MVRSLHSSYMSLVRLTIRENWNWKQKVILSLSLSLSLFAWEDEVWN